MFGGPEGLVILVLVLVLFGGSQLPKLARNLGEAQKEFRTAMDEADKPVTTQPLPAPDSSAPASSAPAPDQPGS